MRIRCLAVVGLVVIAALLLGGCRKPAPVTPDPVTPDPVTPDPVTPDPITPDPITPDPITPDPVTPDPVTPDPVVPDPVIPDPVVPDPNPPSVQINRRIYADVVAIDQPFMVNRLGASQPAGMIYVLKQDLVQKNGGENPTATDFKLRPGKRPRPIALRMNVGDVLQITFSNWLKSFPGKTGGKITSSVASGTSTTVFTANLPGSFTALNGQQMVFTSGANNGATSTIKSAVASGSDLQITVNEAFAEVPKAGDGFTISADPNLPLELLPFFKQYTRDCGLHVNGLDLVPGSALINPDGTPVAAQPGIASDGSWVGKNASSLAAPGETRIYGLYATNTGTFLLSSGSDTTVHQLNAGLFGAVHVQPKGAEYYRSQTTYKQMQAATQTTEDLINYEVTLQDFDLTDVKQRDVMTVPSQSYKTETSDPTSQRKRSLKYRVMTDRQFHTKTADFVYIEESTMRVYSPAGQPLINYHSVFDDDDVNSKCEGAVPGKPVLSMIQVVKGTQHKYVGPNAPADGKYPLKKSNYDMQLQQLAAGVIPPDLRTLFDKNKSWWNQPLPTLSLLATIARAPDRDPFTWVITDEGGRTYRVQATTNADKTQAFLEISDCSLQLIYSDLTAIISGPNAGLFPVSEDSPDFYTNPASPERRQPFREFTIIYHQGGNLVQAFPQWSNNNLFRMINAGLDQFGINYGIAAIGPEIVANRLGVGPMGSNYGTTTQNTINPAPSTANDAVDLKYEEFFLSSWCVGDPSMVVDVPANIPNAYVSNPDDDGGKVVGTVEPNPVSFTEFDLLKQREKFDPANPYANRPTKAFYPDDPSNVYHGYMRDHTKMRVLHAGPGPAHVHHLHAHQWLHSPNSPDGHYLDSQLIIPGTGYTLEITYNGAGNRNQTVGDSIFHCHFYPHFAKGMWSLWRVHDTFEEGTVLDDNGVCVTKVDADGKPVSMLPYGNAAYKNATPVANRALPDGEIASGSPTPAVVPLPTLGMAPMPARLKLADLQPYYAAGVGMGRRIEVIPKNQAEIDAAKKANAAVAPGVAGLQQVPEPVYDNPGYPFFIPGISGHRAPHPPLDTAWLEVDGDRKYWSAEDIRTQLKLDPATSSIQPGDLKLLNGGLPRHVVLGGNIVSSYNTRWDFSKDFIVEKDNETFGGLFAFELPEDGTPVEKAAMAANATRTFPSFLPQNGKHGHFILNGLPPVPGAPYADPAVTDDGNSVAHPRRYQAAVIQTDVVLNKKGWHYPQQRFLTLWEDVQATIDNTRPPQPFFIRTATGDATEFWHTNLIPNYYELDDFQVRTPTDVIGQHIHLVKFDVTASDGAANGFNYEDATFGPDEIRERIHAITKVGGLYGFDKANGFVNVEPGSQRQVGVWPNRYAYPPRTTTAGVKVGTDADGLFGPSPEGQNWDGAMTSIQRWAIDPLLNWQGHDRTLRTVFTHDHLSPSTHQQVGLYAGVLVEPENSQWFLPDGEPMYTREDGGPTSWQAIIVPKNPADAHREYAIEFQDMQLAYTGAGKIPLAGSNDLFKPKLTGAALAKIQTVIPDYPTFADDPNKPAAPAAFYIGQASVSEAASVAGVFIPQLLRGDLNSNFVRLFAQYGIELSDKATVTPLFDTDPNSPEFMELLKNGFLTAQWLIQQPPLTSSGPVNGGDYYIVRAGNPVTTQGQKAPRALSVYTPVVAPGYADPPHAVNPNWGSNRTNGNDWAGNIGTPVATEGNSGVGFNDRFGNGAPFPSLVSTRANGTYSVNYRNEPVQLRVAKGTGKQTDLAYAFSSIPRNDVKLNTQPPPFEIGADGKPKVEVVEVDGKKQFAFVRNAASENSPYAYPPFLIPGKPGVSTLDPPVAGLPKGKAYPGSLVPPTSGGPGDTDPFTPLLRGYPGDKIQIRTLVGAHLQPHAFTIHDVKWLFEPSYKNSGWRNVQGMGISEHFEMIFDLPTEMNPTGTADYFYSASTGAVGLSNGLWGIMRAYKDKVDYLEPLINNSVVKPSGERVPKPHVPIDFEEQYSLATNKREFTVVAINAAQALPNGKLVYNNRANLALSNAVMFAHFDDMEVTEQGFLLKNNVNVEPLILRARAGEWIKVTLANSFSANADAAPFNSAKQFWFGNPFNGLNDAPELQKVDMFVSRQASLHPQLVEFDGTKANGINVGTNPDQTVGPGGGQKVYYWYAGEFKKDDDGQILRDANGKVQTIPMEFGATTLTGADLILQTQFGQVGALVIEPEGSSWPQEREKDPVTGKLTRAFTTVTHGGKSFRECVLVMQNMVASDPPAGTTTDITTPGREATPQQTSSPRQAGFGVVNYRTEVFSSRFGGGAQPADLGFSGYFSNNLRNFVPPPKVIGEPKTPIFYAEPGDQVRFRIVMPSTTSANSAAQPLVIDIHGHGWQEEPYINGGRRIGTNKMSQFIGSQKLTVTQKYDFVIDSAGGAFRQEGDYLYQAFQREQRVGIWGLFRVQKKPWTP